MEKCVSLQSANGVLAQLVERLNGIQKVRSSILLCSTKSRSDAGLYSKRGISSVGRAPGSQSGGQGFDPPMLHFFLLRGTGPPVTPCALFGFPTLPLAKSRPARCSDEHFGLRPPSYLESAPLRPRDLLASPVFFYTRCYRICPQGHVDSATLHRASRCFDFSEISLTLPMRRWSAFGLRPQNCR